MKNGTPSLLPVGIKANWKALHPSHAEPADLLKVTTRLRSTVTKKSLPQIHARGPPQP
jgi:hypothetical protein